MNARQRVIRGRPAFAPRRTLVAFAAVATLAAPAAWADSGLIGDTTLGNSIVPQSEGLRLRDAEGLGAESANKRTPTGFLLVAPYVFGEKTAMGGDSGWISRGSVELGGLMLNGDRDAALFGAYRTLKNGAYLAGLSFEAEKPKEGLFVEATAGGLGYDDQYLGASVGRYNSWKLSGFYNETNHVFTSTYRNLWDGTGTSRLTLRPATGLTAGGVTNAATTYAQVVGAVAATPYSALSVIREKGGLRFEVHLSETAEIFANLTNEHRKGARPFGLVMGAGGGTGGVEIPESVNYDTTDVVAGLRWHNQRTSANVQVSTSMFRNHVDTLTIDSPMFLAAANGIASFPQARFDMYPDNDMYNVKAEVAHSMPELARLRLTGVVSLTQMRQNDSLIAPTMYSGAAVNAAAGGSWDTNDSLYRKSAKARVDTQLIDLGAAFSPADSVDVRAKLRRFETSNKMPQYYACNPLTGQWGRLNNDGSGAAMVNTPAYLANPADWCNLAAIQGLGVIPSAGNVNIGSIPYEYTQDNASGSVEWRFARTQTLNASLERETMKRENREYTRTHEDKLKVGYVNRNLAGGTLRASLEGAQRRGNTYNPDPYEEFYSAAMGPEPTTGNLAGYVHTNGLMRKYDLADRDMTTLNLRFNTALAEDVDFMVTAQLREMKYPDSAYGRIGRQRQNSLNFDLNWQPTPTTSLFGFAAQQDLRMHQKGVQTNACAVGTTYYFWDTGAVTTTAAQPTPGATLIGTATPTATDYLTVCGNAGPLSPLRPESRAWTVTQTDRSTSVGIGGRHDFGPARLDATYTWTNGVTKTGYAYNNGINANPTALGTGFPDMKIQQEAIDANLLIPMGQKVTFRLMLRHERGKVSDWHYQNAAINPTPAAQQVYLDAGPQDYRVTAVGAFVQVAW